MLSGVRFRAYPAAALQATLRVWIGHQRFIYNAKTREHRYWARFARHSLALTGCKPLPDQAYSQFVGEDTPWLRDAPSQVLRNGAYRFANATTRMLKGLGGAPRIKKKHGRQSVLLTSELFRFKTVTDPNTGEVRFKKPKTARVRGRQVKVGPGRPEPDVLPRPTPVESSSDAVCHSVAHRAVLVESGDAATSARWAPGSR